ncbi:MAG TPA: DUF6178 family protein [Myxococcales bacterium]|nr:DUF6178 family protein [Myxococcales bacterium]
MSTAILDVRAARRALQNARGKQKLELILAAPDPEQLVRALPAEELYFALLEIGPDDAAELVAMAAPEQFRHLVDMAAWRGTDEGPRTEEVARWLRLAREGGDDAARFRAQLGSLDLELLALLLRRQLVVHDLVENEEPPTPENPGLAFYTPDRRFLLELTGPAGFATLRQLVEDLYAEDPFGAGQLIEAARWELPTELEESARHWRDGRLRDAGVPGFDEAISFYARPAAQKPAASGAAPEPQALAQASRPLLDAALDQLEGGELERAEEAVVYAANAALVANRVSLHDPDEVREQLADARATLSLGLELLSSGDPGRAAAVLVEGPIRSVFQAAVGEGYRLQARARNIAARARLPQAQSATVLDEPLESVVQGLLRARPAFHEPGQRRPRALGSRADVLRAEALLDEAEAELALLAALGIPPAVLGPRAEEAGLGPAAVKASAALRALVETQLRGEPFSLRGAADEPGARAAGFDEKLDELLRGASRSGIDGRVSDRLRTMLRR